MKLTDAMLCLDCNEVFEGCTACPRCLNKYSMSLSRVLNRKEPEREVVKLSVVKGKRRAG